MKLLFTLQNFPPSTFGGISTSMYSIIKSLNNTNYEIKVLTTNYKLPFTGIINTNCWTNFNGIAINYIKTRFPAFSIRYLFEGFKQIKKADQVHISSVFFFPSLVFTLISNILGKTVIVTPHGELQESALSYKSWKKVPYLVLIKKILEKAVFRATSEEEANQIKKYFPKSDIYLIPNFFTLEPALHLTKLNQFVYLGRICKIKRIENLILACSISNLFIQSNFKLIIAGPLDKEFLDYKSMLKVLISSNNLDKNIEFIGEVNSPQKEELLSQSKALFLVSHSENFGNVVVEALAQGTPVVATQGTPWKSLVDYNCGYWIDNSPESIASCIDEIISMKKNIYKIMSDNSIILSNEFTEENTLPKWKKIINKTERRKNKNINC